MTALADDGLMYVMIPDLRRRNSGDGTSGLGHLSYPTELSSQSRSAVYGLQGTFRLCHFEKLTLRLL